MGITYKLVQVYATMYDMFRDLLSTSAVPGCDTEVKMSFSHLITAEKL